MDLFGAIVFGGLALMVGAFLLLGRMRYRTSDITDKKDRERWATQAQIEERDIGHMIEGQNALRREHGERELTQGDLEREIAAQERARFEAADREAAKRTDGP